MDLEGSDQQTLGRGLALLHQHSGRVSPGRFGWDRDGFIGAGPQPGGWRERWGSLSLALRSLRRPAVRGGPGLRHLLGVHRRRGDGAAAGDRLRLGPAARAGRGVLAARPVRGLNRPAVLRALRQRAAVFGRRHLHLLPGLLGGVRDAPLWSDGRRRDHQRCAAQPDFGQGIPV